VDTDNGTIDGRTKEDVLTAGWQNEIKILATRGKIKEKQNDLIKLIDSAKESERFK
jgi:hypothetical protein